MSRRGWALFLALAVIWGMPYLFIKVAIGHLSPAVLVTVRCALAALILLPPALRAPGGLALVAARRRWVAVFALVEVIGPFGLLSTAEQRLTSSLTGLLVAGVPLVGAVIGAVLRLADRIDARRLAGLLVGFAGVAGLVGLDVRGGDVLSVGAVLLATVGYALGPVVMDRRLAGLPSYGVSAVSMGVTALVYAPWAAATWPREPVPWTAWGSVAVLGAVCSALAFVLMFALVAEVGPARATVITYLNPAVAVALGVVLLGEPLTAGIVLGFPLVLLGSAIATGRSRTAQPHAEPAPS